MTSRSRRHHRQPELPPPDQPHGAAPRTAVPAHGPDRRRAARVLRAYVNNDFVDRYVKIAFPQPGIDYPEPLDLWTIRETMPREQWPHTRTYTVRWVDEAAGELAIDFVVHGDEGLAGPWAAARRARRQPRVHRPRRRATTPTPRPTGTSSPATNPPCRRSAPSSSPCRSDARGLAFLEVDSDADIQAIAAPAGVELGWLLPPRRSRRRAATCWSTPCADAEWPDGRVQVFAHGERGYMKALRDVLLCPARTGTRARCHSPATGPRAGWRTTSRPRRNCQAIGQDLTAPRRRPSGAGPGAARCSPGSSSAAGPGYRRARCRQRRRARSPPR